MSSCSIPYSTTARDLATVRRGPRQDARPAASTLLPAVLMIAAIAAISPAWRIYLLPALLAAFGYAFRRNPVGALAILAFLLGFPVYLRVSGRDASTMSTLLIIEAYALALLQRRPAWEKHLVPPAVLLMLVYAVGSAGLWGSEALLHSTRLLLGLVAALMLLHLVLSYVRTRSDATPILVALVAMLALQVAIGVAQLTSPVAYPQLLAPFAPRDWSWRSAWMPYEDRASGAMGDYELLAEWFAGAVPLALCAAGAGRRRLSRLGGLALLAILAIGILVTGTRGGAVAAAVGVAAFLLLLARRSAGRALQLTLVLAIVLGLTFLWAMLAMPHAITEYVARMTQVVPYLEGGRVSSAQLLFRFLARALNRGRWLGLPSFITAPHLYPYGFFPLESLHYRNAGSLHALWLTIWFQGGIIGTAAWLWLAAGAWRAHRWAPRIRPLRRTEVLSLALVAGLAAMLTSEIKVEFLRGEHLIAFFFLMLGLSIAVSRIAAPGSPQEAKRDAPAALGA